MDQTEPQKTYVCTGSCGAHISQDEYDAGLTACGTEGCSMKGHPFVEESADMHGAHDAASPKIEEETLETTETVTQPAKDEDDVIINNN